jgi:Ca2+-binding RTX toxin-like protein
MARLQVYGGYAFDLASLSLYNINYGSSYLRLSNVFEARYGFGDADTFYGRGFTYSTTGIPTGGKVTSYEATADGSVAARISGVSISVPDLVNAAQTVTKSDDMAIYERALSGNDTLTGHVANDVINGFAGNDVITGGGGQDLLIGGLGEDRFVFTRTSDSRKDAADTISNFRRGEDVIDLSRIDADTDGSPDNQQFTWIGAKAFTGVDGQLHFVNGFVEGDTNGDKVADFRIKVTGVTSLSAIDFDL